MSTQTRSAHPWVIESDQDQSMGAKVLRAMASYHALHRRLGLAPKVIRCLVMNPWDVNTLLLESQEATRGCEHRLSLWVDPVPLTRISCGHTFAATDLNADPDITAGKIWINAELIDL